MRFGSMRLLLIFILIFVSAAELKSAERQSALAALKLIPEADRKQLARIEGRDGSPTPERWYFEAYASGAENGVRESVVANRRLVLRREISQFTPSLQPSDALGRKILIDSDRVTQLVRQYARVNNMEVALFDYSLAKSGPEGSPAWTVRCADTEGKFLGAITVSAHDGTVLTQEGFAIVPPPEVANSTTPSPKAGQSADGGRSEPTAEKSRTYKGRRVRRSEPPPFPDPVRHVIKPLRRLIHDLLPF